MNNDQSYPASTLQWPEHITPRHAAKLLVCGMRLLGRPQVVHFGLSRETISWRLRQDSWFSVQWFTVTEYIPGLIRLRNDVMPSIPKHVWPLPLPEMKRFELTFHESEISEELGEPFYAFCSAMGQEGVILGWPLFTGEQSYPQYAWTQRAQEFYKHRQCGSVNC